MTDTPAEKPSFKLQKIRVFLTEHPSNKGEAIVTINTPQGVMPLIAVDEKQYAAFCAAAQDMANGSGMSIHVAEFNNRVEGQVFERQLVVVPGLNLNVNPAVEGAFKNTKKIGDGGFKIGDKKKS